MSEVKKYTLLKDINLDTNKKSDTDSISETDSIMETGIVIQNNEVKVHKMKYKNIVLSAIVFVLVYISLYLTKYYNLIETRWSILVLSSMSSIIYYFFNIFL